MARLISRAKGVAEHASAEAMKNLNKLKNEPYMAYLKRKLGEWYREPGIQGHCAIPSDDEEEPTGLGRRRRPAARLARPRRKKVVTPAMAAPLWGLHLISKV
jgi:hypothetical protein